MDNYLRINVKFIHHRMRDLDLSNSDLASRMNVPQSTVWRMFHGKLKTGVTTKTTGKLMRALDLKTKDLDNLFIFA